MARFAFLFILLLSFTTSAADSPLVIYTSRKTHLITPILKAYTQETGQKIRHVNGKAGALIQRIKQEGGGSPADILMTVDAGNLWFGAEQGLFRSLESPTLARKVPDSLRDSKNRWFAFSTRARTIFFNKNKIKPSDLKNYSDLANKKWKGRLCLRTSRKVYNQSLVAGLIERVGETSAAKTVAGWVDNLALPVFTSDSLLLEAIDQGQCAVGIANTYYLARMVQEGKAKNVGVFWPAAKDGGVHINVSGGAVLKTSKNPDQAQRFLEWLVSPKAQKAFAGINHEYPVVSSVALSPVIAQWGDWKADKTPLDRIGPLQKKAVRLMDRAGYR